MSFTKYDLIKYNDEYYVIIKKLIRVFKVYNITKYEIIREYDFGESVDYKILVDSEKLQKYINKCKNPIKYKEYYKTSSLSLRDVELYGESIDETQENYIYDKKKYYYNILIEKN